jgi:hypothetical protein
MLKSLSTIVFDRSIENNCLAIDGKTGKKCWFSLQTDKTSISSEFSPT